MAEIVNGHLNSTRQNGRLTNKSVTLQNVLSASTFIEYTSRKGTGNYYKKI